MIVARGGKRGKTAGRGGKGQSARAGNKRRPEWRDIIKKLPKLRGRGKSPQKGFQERPTIVNLSAIEAVFSANDNVTPTTLIEKGIISTWSGHTPLVKILGDGEITKALKVSGCTISESAKAKIEKAGGSIVALPSRILVKELTEAQAKKAARPKRERKPEKPKEKEMEKGKVDKAAKPKTEKKEKKEPKPKAEKKGK
jgi:large subunit ribosomal protein L15